MFKNHNVPLAQTQKFLLAAQNGETQTLANLLQANPALLNATMIARKTALHYTAENGHVEASRLLIDNNADIFAEDIGGRAAIYRAEHAGHEEISKMIWSKATESNQLELPSSGQQR